ncbi:unnamed protein product [Nezara viridula]|uniref:Uncharacterized protein n=1 Tax=Nezara viridula TaxID=85310 RepID=A0A9P0GY28_NEZVI|nr:unnamed protein product [Nezara viridula]
MLIWKRCHGDRLGFHQCLICRNVQGVLKFQYFLEKAYNIGCGTQIIYIYKKSVYDVANFRQLLKNLKVFYSTHCLYT